MRGESGVGKTTLIKTFCAGKPEEHEFVATPRGSKSGGASATAAAETSAEIAALAAARAAAEAAETAERDKAAARRRAR